MALDELQKNDLTFTDQEVQFIIDKDLFEEAKPIRIDFIESPGGAGFQITSSLPAGDCGGGCS